MKAVKLPIEIEYYPCEEKYVNEILKWSTDERPINIKRNWAWILLYIEIKTLEWWYCATVLDMIIKWIDGECYPCKKDIFYKTYKLL